MEPERLYGPGDMARVLGISAAAVCNRVARGDRRMPAPAFVHGRKRNPLWTRAQLETVIAERAAEMERALDTAPDSVYR